MGTFNTTKDEFNFILAILEHENVFGYKKFKKYQVETDIFTVKKNIVPLEMGKLIKIYEKMKENGATPDEFTAVFNYAIVLNHAVEHNLDYRKAKEVFKVKEIAAKYK